MSKPAIQVREVSKRFRLNAQRVSERALGAALASAIARPFRRGRGGAVGGEDEGDFVWALRDVSFEVRPGEAVGIVGHNGAGKSTLLRILSRLTLPTSGSITVRGQIASMLGLGVGFNAELTGRENALLNGVLLGKTRAEMRRRLPDIAEFSGLGGFIDVPVKQYSSGMKLRLGFSVMATVEPEILLLDEVLGVGDASFRQRSSAKMQELIKSGRTVLLVSHNERVVDELCDWTVRLEKGRLVETGDASQVVSHYLEEQADEEDEPAEHAELPDDPAKPAVIRGAAILDAQGERASVVELSQPLRVRVMYDVHEPVEGVVVFCRIETVDAVTALGSGDVECDSRLLGVRTPGRYTAEFEVPGQTLEAGRYRVGVSIGPPFGRPIDRKRRLVSFNVVDESSSRRLVYAQTRPGVAGREQRWTYVDGDPCG